MDSILRAYIVVLCLGTASFFLLRPLYNQIILKPNIEAPKYTHLFYVWLLITTLIFVIRDIWILFGAISLFSALITKNINHRIAWYFFLLFISPRYVLNIGGFAGIQSLISLSYPALLGLVILGPIFKKCCRDNGNTRLLSTSLDKMVFLYCILLILNFYRDEGSIAASLKYSVQSFAEIIIPYVVISRGVNSFDSFKAIAFTLVLSGTSIALYDIVEFVKTWRLYVSTDSAIGSQNIFIAYYSFRGGYLRATSIFIHPIVNGYFLVFSIAALAYLQKEIIKNKQIYLTFFVLAAGLFATSSRGPWFGCFVFFLVYLTILNPHKFRSLTKLFLIGICGVLLLITLGQGERIYKLLPFVGGAEVDTYRTKLITNSFEVISRNPIFGLSHQEFLATPEMEEMRQGEGIIDVVNSYLAILLHSGVIGMLMYLAIFLLPARDLYFTTRRRLKTVSKLELRTIQFFLGIMAAHFFIIGTVSSIGYIKELTFLLASLAAAFQIISKNTQHKLLKQKLY